MNKHWYVLMTIGGQEVKAKRKLEQYNQTVFCPMIYPDPKSKLKTKAVPLFKNYIFIQMSTEAVFTDPVNTPGVLKWVNGTDRYPAKIADQIISSLMDQEIKAFNNRIPKEYKPGQKVTIIEGIYKDWEGIYQKTANQRLGILLKTLGESQIMYFPADCVEPLSP